MFVNKNNRIQRLPDSELDIMLVLWDAEEPLSKREITKLLKEKKNWSISTVQVLLTRLVERGYVEIVKQKRFNFYKAIIREDIYRKNETQSFIERIHGNSYKKLIATLVESKTIDGNDIDEIVDIIKKASVKEK